VKEAEAVNRVGICQIKWIRGKEMANAPVKTE
jgi:hypothetical protein